MDKKEYVELSRVAKMTGVELSGRWMDNTYIAWKYFIVL